MCGIAGFIIKAQREAPDGLLKQMADVIEHRGPDEEGYFVDQANGVYLANRRLSIIDISGGSQPMSNDDESIWITYNGEIYNFPELRSRLETSGHRFKTRSDTEVILKCYEQYGIDAFAKLNGIFGFAIYDRRLQKTFLVRDRFGVKPVYYCESPIRTLFGSEIRSIFRDPSLERLLSEPALNEFLAFRYNPSPNTLFEGITKLAPGHYIEVTTDGCTDQKKYLSNEPAVTKIDEDEAINRYRILLSDAVRRQVISDVPIGLFLSGGIDSAAIGKLMSDASSTPIKTYSIGFHGKGAHNELDDARATAKILRSEHHEITIDADEYLRYFATSFETLEEPIAETSVSALYYLSQRAAADVKVVLAGQGADEPMGGYQRHLGISFIEKYGAFVRAASPFTRVISRAGRLKQAVEVARFTTEIDRLVAAYSIFTPKQRALLLLTTANGKVEPARLTELLDEAGRLPHLLSRSMYVDTRLSLSDDLLLFNDKVTMANSLEMRVPFLDNELITYLETLPPDMKLRGTTRKYIHKKAAEAWLPSKIVHRKKRGFQTPMDTWLQRDLAWTSLSFFEENNSAARRYFDLDFVKRLVNEHVSRRQDHQKRLYGLLCFELWHRTWIDRTPIDPEKLVREASSSL
jgi:asparagine synthase (glutamine-hydrolysing)